MGRHGNGDRGAPVAVGRIADERRPRWCQLGGTGGFDFQPLGSGADARLEGTSADGAVEARDASGKTQRVTFEPRAYAASALTLSSAVLEVGGVGLELMCTPGTLATPGRRQGEFG